ncbi:hypothetical protein KEM48_007872 [Puccinia striiformis f. sp. tritici PST-130]|nr:hypothetical protein KEM48_007872 [Puccinia striiformis f. sp. tritici PST-130]
MLSTTKIPVSLSHQNGILVGKKAIIDRIRINAISLILLWIITSTKIYNETINSISTRIPFLMIPLQITEWSLLVILIGNLIEAYYRLKTQKPTTHIDLPLTPQQIRGSILGSSSQKKKNGLSSSLGYNNSPFRKSIHSPMPSSPTPLFLNSTTEANNPYHKKKEIILSSDPTINPLSRSTAHLFKKRPNSTDLSSSSYSSSSPSRPSNQYNYLESSLNRSFLNSSSNNNNRSSGFRSVSNSVSLQKLLDEVLAPTSTSTSNSTTIVPSANPNLNATSTSNSHLSSSNSATVHNPNLIPTS